MQKEESSRMQSPPIASREPGQLADRSYNELQHSIQRSNLTQSLQKIKVQMHSRRDHPPPKALRKCYLCQPHKIHAPRKEIEDLQVARILRKLLSELK